MGRRRSPSVKLSDDGSSQRVPPLAANFLSSQVGSQSAVGCHNITIIIIAITQVTTSKGSITLRIFSFSLSPCLGKKSKLHRRQHQCHHRACKSLKSSTKILSRSQLLSRSALVWSGPSDVFGSCSLLLLHGRSVGARSHLHMHDGELLTRPS